MRTIQLYDTTLRDGEQTPFVVFSVEQKLTLARAIAEMGVDIIEVGFPAASESEQEAVRKVAQEVKSSVIAGLAAAGPVTWTSPPRPSKLPTKQEFP